MDYVPQRGEYISVTFDPQAGHEQRGRRPALVISRTAFNQRTGLALVCPITNTDRKFPFHVPVCDARISGFVMTEQVKSIDFRARQAKRAGKASMEVLNEVLSILEACLF
jgi:mRNA interferase MazF